MKTFSEQRPRISIVGNGETLTNDQYSKIRRVAAMLEANDFDVVIKDIQVECNLLTKFII